MGIERVGQPGTKTIRWKEIISPKAPVVAPMLPAQGPSIQPRVALQINGSPPLPVSIDSGASLNLFDAELALQHGVKVADPKSFGNVFQGLGGEEFSY